MDIKDEILNDPQCAPYTDIRYGWVNEAFLDGVEYGERITINRILAWMEANMEESKVCEFKNTIESNRY